MKKLLVLTVLLIGCTVSSVPVNSVEHDRPGGLPGYNFNSIGREWYTFNIRVDGREFKMLGHNGYNSLAITTLYEISSTNVKTDSN